EFALVEEGDDEQNHTEDGERNDAVEAIEIRAVVQKDFADNQAKEDEGLPTQQGRFLFDAQSDERGSIGGPEEREREVLGKTGINTEAGVRAEMVPELEGEGEQREN